MASPSAVPAAPCYFPDGSVAVNYGTCGNWNGLDGQQTCCPPQSSCLASNMCQTGPDQYIRGACTDRTWASSGCPSFCTSHDLGTTSPITICTTNSTTTVSCCPYGGSCNCNLNNPNEELVGTGPLLRQKYIPGPKGLSGSGMASTVTVTAAKTTITSSGANGSITKVNSGGGLSPGAAAGIGVACAIAGVIIGVLVILLLWKMRSKKKGEVPPAYYGYGEKKQRSSGRYGGAPTELQGRQRAELADEQSYELPSGSPQPDFRQRSDA